MLKVELHTHTADDPVDRIPHTTIELIDRAAELHYNALAITLHERWLDVARFRRHADKRGIVLIPGVERTIEGKHVLLLNFDRRAEDVSTFADLRRLKRSQTGLVIAPHPFYPSGSSLFGQLDRHADLFDAVEYNAMFTRTLNGFNHRAARWAARHGKPLVGNGDVHRLRQLGSTYSLVDAEPDADAICAAVLAGRVQVRSRPLPWSEVFRILPDMVVSGFFPPEAVEQPVAAPINPEPAESVESF